eukprot:1112579-Amphidinium_carterae.1
MASLLSDIQPFWKQIWPVHSLLVMYKGALEVAHRECRAEETVAIRGADVQSHLLLQCRAHLHVLRFRQTDTRKKFDGFALRMLSSRRGSLECDDSEIARATLPAICHIARLGQGPTNPSGTPKLEESH